MFSRECIRRAVRTFIQTAIGYIAVVVPNIDFADSSALKTTLIGVGVSAAAAGAAAVMNINKE